jgi:hypothetical protein
MKIYTVTVTNTVLDNTREVVIQAKNPQEAHKEALFTEVNQYENIVEMSNEKGVLVYGDKGFVNIYRDLED